MTLSVLGTQTGTAKTNDNTHQIPYTGASSINAPNGTLAIVLVTVTYDTSPTDSALSFANCYWGGTSLSLTKSDEYYDSACGGNVSIWYMNKPTNFAFEDATLVSWGTGGTCTDLMGALIFVGCKIEEDVIATEATGNGSPSITWSTSAITALAVAGSLSDQSVGGNLSCNDTSIFIEDVGSDTALACYALRTSSGSQTLDWTDTDNDEDWVAVGVSYKEYGTIEVSPTQASCVVGTTIGSVVADTEPTEVTIGGANTASQRVEGQVMVSSDGNVWVVTNQGSGTRQFTIWKNCTTTPVSVTTVTTSTIFGTTNSIYLACVLDSNDKIHVIVVDATVAQAVKYRVFNTSTETWEGSGWETAASHSETRVNICDLVIDIDSNDIPAFLWKYDISSVRKVRFYHRSGGSWSSAETGVIPSNSSYYEGINMQIRGTLAAGTVSVTIGRDGNYFFYNDRVAGTWGSGSEWSTTGTDPKNQHGGKFNLVHDGSNLLRMSVSDGSDLYINDTLEVADKLFGDDILGDYFGAVWIEGALYVVGKSVTSYSVRMLRYYNGTWTDFGDVWTATGQDWPGINRVSTNSCYNVNNNPTDKLYLTVYDNGPVNDYMKLVIIPLPDLPSGLDVEPSPASAIVSTVDPTFQNPIEVTPSASAVVVRTINPSVIEGDFITPTPAYTITSTVAPSVYEPEYVDNPICSTIVSVVAPEVFLGETGRVFGPAWQSG